MYVPTRRKSLFIDAFLEPKRLILSSLFALAISSPISAFVTKWVLRSHQSHLVAWACRAALERYPGTETLSQARINLGMGWRLLMQSRVQPQLFVSGLPIVQDIADGLFQRSKFNGVSEKAVGGCYRLQSLCYDSTVAAYFSRCVLSCCLHCACLRYFPSWLLALTSLPWTSSAHSYSSLRQDSF